MGKTFTDIFYQTSYHLSSPYTLNVIPRLNRGTHSVRINVTVWIPLQFASQIQGTTIIFYSFTQGAQGTRKERNI